MLHRKEAIASSLFLNKLAKYNGKFINVKSDYTAPSFLITFSIVLPIIFISVFSALFS